MRRLVLAVFALLLAPALYAQTTGNTRSPFAISSNANQEFNNALTSAGYFGIGPRQALGSFPTCGATNLGATRVDTGSSNAYYCNGTSWSALSTGGGGAAFSAITSGTNTTATMTLGTGSALTSTGGVATFLDQADFVLENIADNTKKLEFNLSSMTTGTTVVWSLNGAQTAIAIGAGAGTNSTVLGPGASAGGTGTLALGLNASAGTGTDAIAIGDGSSITGVATAFAIGGGTTNASNDAVFGGPNVFFYNWYIGRGKTAAAAPGAIFFQPTPISGTNANGVSFSAAGGAGTGTGTPGFFGRKYWLTQASGTTQDTQSANVYPLAGTLFTQFTAVSVTNTVSATSMLSGSILGTTSVEAGILIPGQQIHCQFSGTITDTLTPNLTFLVSLGGTTIVSTGTVALVAITGTESWRADIELVTYTVGSSGTIQGTGIFTYGTSTVGGTTLSMNTTTPVTINTTTAEAIGATAQWGTASASNTIVAQAASCAYVQ